MPPIIKPQKIELESHIQQKIRLSLGKEPDLLLHRNAKWSGVIEGGRYVNAGLQPNGSSDLIGILTIQASFCGATGSIGRFFALEVKKEGEIPSVEYLERLVARMMSGEALSEAQGRDANQWLYIKLVRNRGGFACYVDSVDGAKAALGRARRGERK